MADYIAEEKISEFKDIGQKLFNIKQSERDQQKLTEHPQTVESLTVHWSSEEERGRDRKNI